MKLRESGMPEEAYWETLFDVPLILDRLGIDGRLRDVVELGCGFGTFTIPVARRISGTLTTLDIDPVMVERTRQRAADAGVRNLVGAVRDVFADGFGVRSASQDAVLLFNILHGEEPVRLLTEAASAVKPGGAVLVIHWRPDPATPRGPTMEIRPRPEPIVTWAGQAGLFAAGPVLDLPPWHFGIQLQRREPDSEARMRLLILGTGCAKCAKLYEATVQAANELGVSYEIAKITDLKQIMALGVMLTPALVVNGTVKLSGKVPKVEELKVLLRQAAAEKTGD